jgi:hypothetical protein
VETCYVSLPLRLHSTTRSLTAAVDHLRVSEVDALGERAVEAGHSDVRDLEVIAGEQFTPCGTNARQ